MTSTAPPESESSDDIGPPAELGPIIRSYHFYNDLVAGVLSIMLNVLVILVFTTRISTASKLFKKVMTVTKLVEMLFSASYILTAPVSQLLMSNGDGWHLIKIMYCNFRYSHQFRSMIHLLVL